MFTGLIEEVGTVSSIREREHSKQLQIVAPRTARKLRVGDSVAVNGCCLTLTAHRGDQLTFNLLEETLDRTNLKMLRRQWRKSRARSPRGRPVRWTFRAGPRRLRIANHRF